MITSIVCHGFYTTVEAFSCTEFGCAVRSALLAEFQAHLSFLLLFFKYSIIFLKPICLRHQSMDCFSPCRPLLPFWLGKGMATLLRGSLDSARFGFSLWAIIVPRFCSASAFSWHFHPSSPPLPFPAIPSLQVGGVGMLFPSQRGGSA